MGEYADMILDGCMCEGCGEFMGDSVGFTRLCSSCAREARASGQSVRPTGLGGFQNVTPHAPAAKVPCPTCGKRVKPAGLQMHINDKHGSKAA